MATDARVLVIDDDPDVSLLARLQLENAGYDVVEAATAAEGLSRALERVPDIVLLDWMLPDGDGIGVLADLKADPATAHVPVVMVTARSHAGDQELAWEAGVVDYLTKPFDGSELLRCVRSALAEPSPAAQAARREDALARLSGRRTDPDRAAAVVANAADAIVTLSLDGAILMWNRAAEALYGHEADDVLGQPAAVLAPPGRRDEVAEALERVAAGEPVGHFETVRRRRDGTDVAVSMAISPVRDEGGHITAASAISRDITEQKANESLYRGLLEAAPDAMVVVDDTGVIQLVNARAEALFGYRREELVGGPIEALVPEHHRALHPELRGRYSSAPHPRPMGGLDLAAQHKDGSVFPAEISLSSIETERGRLISVAVRDVSERKAAEGRFRGLVDAAPDAMVIVDADGRIEIVNSQTEAMFGYGRGELVGRPVEVLVPHRFRDLHPDHRSAYTGSAHVRPMGAGLELFALRKDGSEFPVEISLSPLQTGGTTTISAAIRDVTARKRAESVQVAAFDREREASRRLREVDRLRSDFLSTVSHELRTPLTAIRGFADLLVEHWDETDPEQRLALVQRISGAGLRLDRLIEDLLDFTRLERGQLGIDLEAHRVEALVEEALRHVAVSLERHEVAVDVEPGLVALVDEVAIARVLVNLLTNAAKFSPIGSTISIEAVSDADRIALAVVDEGEGIPAEEQEHIFERFYRVERGTARRPGTGVGLAIVKEFTEAQGGEVRLRSVPGEGSRFTLRLRPART